VDLIIEMVLAIEVVFVQRYNVLYAWSFDQFQFLFSASAVGLKPMFITCPDGCNAVDLIIWTETLLFMSQIPFHIWMKHYCAKPSGFNDWGSLTKWHSSWKFSMYDVWWKVDKNDCKLECAQNEQWLQKNYWIMENFE